MEKKDRRRIENRTIVESQGALRKNSTSLQDAGSDYICFIVDPLALLSFMSHNCVLFNC